MATKTTPFDPAGYLTSAEDQTELLNDALASGDAGYIANALGVIARAQGMSQVARDAGVTREALYKGLTTTGDPKLSTVVGVLKTLLDLNYSYHLALEYETDSNAPLPGMAESFAYVRGVLATV